MGNYKNVMELLVEETVERHIATLPPRVATYIKKDELVAYALNQLPSLYATTEKGLDYQLLKGRHQYHRQINQAVQQAIAAIRRDPIRRYTPIPASKIYQPLEGILKRMQALLRDDAVNWDTLPAVVERALSRGAIAETHPPSHRHTLQNAIGQRTASAPPPFPPGRSLRHPFAPGQSAEDVQKKREAQTDSTIDLNVVPDAEEITDWSHPFYRF